MHLQSNEIQLKFKSNHPCKTFLQAKTTSKLYETSTAYSISKEPKMIYLSNITFKDEIQEGEETNLSPIVEIKLHQEKSKKIKKQEQISKKDGRAYRSRQRTIKEAQELVERWRQLHEGLYQSETKNFIKYKLDDAAKVVGVPKKSLDDYLLMINHGKKFGFNFEANQSKGFGVLRSFLSRIKKQN